MRRQLLELVRHLLEREEPFARAIVVRRRPPTSSRLGDTAVITADGELHGWIGGSCTTPEVIRQALEAIEEGRPRRVAFGFEDGGSREGSDHDDGGSREGGDHDRGRQGRNGDDTGGIDDDQDEVIVPMTCRSGGSVEVYIEPVVPAPRLLVVGTSPISRAVARIGHAVGWSVIVIGAGEEGEFPEADRVVVGVDELRGSLGDRPASSKLFALVATMGRADERTVLKLLDLRPDYVGVIASPARMQEIRERLEQHEVRPEVIGAIRGPAGLDLGGTTPEEIAVSVLAEIVEMHRRGASMRRTADRSAASRDGDARTVERRGEADEEGRRPGGEADEETRRPRDEADLDTAGSRGGGETVQRREDAGGWAIDPVCGMQVEADRSRPSAAYRGVTFHFCCEGCRDRFLEDPERYASRHAAIGETT